MVVCGGGGNVAVVVVCGVAVDTVGYGRLRGCPIVCKGYYIPFRRLCLYKTRDLPG